MGNKCHLMEVRLFKMKPNEKPAINVLKPGKIANTLRSLGMLHDDLSTCMMILHGLTFEYDNVKHIQLINSVCIS